MGAGIALPRARRTVTARSRVITIWESTGAATKYPSTTNERLLHLKLRRMLLPVAAIVIDACSGGGSSGGGAPTVAPVSPVIRTYSFSDAAVAPNGGTPWQITGVKTTLFNQGFGGNGSRYDALRVDVTFLQDISNALPAPGQDLSSGSQLGVGIAIDRDANPATGVTATCAGGNSPLPFEYLTNASMRLEDGNYNITISGQPLSTSGGSPASEAMVSVSGHVFTETFYLPTLGVFAGSAAPKIGLSFTSFNGLNGGALECVPSSPPYEVLTV